MKMKPVKPRILLVEDDQDVAFLVRDILESKGFRCFWENRGEKVLDRSIVEKPDLILMDIKLIGIDGYTACRRIKRFKGTQNIPVIFISALNTEHDVLEAKDAGGVFYISKPFDMDYLVKKIYDVLKENKQFEAEEVKERRVLYIKAGYNSESGLIHDSIPGILSNSEFILAAVDTPSETLRRARELQPDIILADLDNSKMHPSVLIDVISRNKYTCEIPVLILRESFGQDKNDKNLLASGFNVIDKKNLFLNLLGKMRELIYI
jgi:DNA-binding response OmpR family regulator